MIALFRLNQRVTTCVLAIMFHSLHVELYLFWCKLCALCIHHIIHL